MLAHKTSTFDDSRAIRVLVVPIGENSLFDFHFHTISQLREVPLSELSKPSQWNPEVNNGFRHFEWYNRGSILFEYLRYDRVPNGPGDLDDFQSSRRVLMIMGLINYPELGVNPMAKIASELDYFTRRHPNVLLRRLFLFNYSFAGLHDPYAELLLPAIRDPSLMIVFPPDLLCENGSSMVRVHLSVNMENASIKIIQAFEEQMQICETAKSKGSLPEGSARLPLCTFFDEIDERETEVQSGQIDDLRTSVTNARREKEFAKGSYKKRPAGRLLKWMGDLSLQVCSPLDALQHYGSSINECRLLGDQLWLAGALEGFAAAILLLAELEMPLEDALSRELRALPLSALNKSPSNSYPSIVVRALMLAEERAAEAMSLYSRRVVFCALEVECALRIARLHELAATSPVFKNERWPGHDRRALAYVLRAASVPGLNAQQQIECTIEGSLICKHLGMQRKYALLLYTAALTCAENDNTSLGHALLRATAQQYGIGNYIQGSISSESTVVDALSLDAAEASDVAIVHPERSWPGMRRQLLAHCAFSAKDSGDHRAASRYVAALIRLQMQQAATEGVIVSQWVDALPTDQRAHFLMHLQENLNPGSETVASDACRDVFRLTTTPATDTALAPKSLAAAFSTAAVEVQAGLSTTSTTIGAVVSNTGVASTSQRSVSSSAASTSAVGIPGASSSAADPESPPHKKSVFSLAGVLDRTLSVDADSSIQSSFEPRLLQAIMSAENVSARSPTTSVKEDVNTIEAQERQRHISKAFPFAHAVHAAPTLLPTSPTQDPAYASGLAIAGLPRGLAIPTHLVNLQYKPADPAVESETCLSPISPTISLNKPYDGRTEHLHSPILTPIHSVAAEMSTQLQWALPDALMHGATAALGCTALHIPHSDQKNATDMFVQLAQGLMPMYRVALPEVLYCMQPLLLPIGVRSEKIFSPAARAALSSMRDKSAAPGDTSALAPDAALENMHLSSSDSAPGLFYDPFAETSAKSNKRKGKTADHSVENAVWTVGCLSHVAVTLYNPLAMALEYSAVRVLCTGARHSSHVSPLVVPPFQQQYRVNLSVLPLEAGSLRIVGLELRMGPAVHVIRVDSHGFAYYLPGEQELGSKHGPKLCDTKVHDTTGGAQDDSECSAPRRLRRHYAHRYMHLRSEHMGKGVPADGREDDLAAALTIDGAVRDTSIVVVAEGPTLQVETASLRTGTGADPVDVAALSPEVTIWTSEASFETVVPLPARSPLRPLCLYRGEHRCEWIRLFASGFTGNMTRRQLPIVSLRIIAHQWMRTCEAKGKENGTITKTSTVLHEFGGDLEWDSNATEMHILNEGHAELEKNHSQEQACVSLVGAAYSGSAGDIGAARRLPLPLPMPLVLSEQPHGDSALCLQLQWKQQPSIIGVVLEFQAVGDDPTVRAVGAMRAAAKGDPCGSEPAHESYVDSILQSDGFVNCRRAFLVMPLVPLRGLSAHLAAVDTGLRRCLPLSPQETRQAAAALTALIHAEQDLTASKVATSIPQAAPLVLRDLGELAAKVLVLDNATSHHASVSAVMDSTISYAVPANSTRNIILSLTESAALLGLSNRLHWCMHESSGQEQAPRQSSFGEGEIPVVMAPAQCRAPPQLCIKILCQTSEEPRVGHYMPLMIEVTQRHAGEGAAPQDVWELAVIGYAPEGGSAVDESPAECILTGTLRTTFTMKNLPYKQHIGAWFTQAGTYKILALVRRKDIKEDVTSVSAYGGNSCMGKESEWFGRQPLEINVPKEAV